MLSVGLQIGGLGCACENIARPLGLTPVQTRREVRRACQPQKRGGSPLGLRLGLRRAAPQPVDSPWPPRYELPTFGFVVATGKNATQSTRQPRWPALAFSTVRRRRGASRLCVFSGGFRPQRRSRRKRLRNSGRAWAFPQHDNSQPCKPHYLT